MIDHEEDSPQNHWQQQPPLRPKPSGIGFPFKVKYFLDHYPVESSEAHLLLGLLINLRHCDGLHRLLSLDLLTATVRFDALKKFNNLSVFRILSKNLPSS